jgi:hypothetical protein
VKRPILVALAAAILNIGVVGSAPARATTPDSTTAAATPAHDHGDRHHYRDHDSRYGSHRHHYRDDDGDDDYDGHGRRHRCAGLIVICLL